MRKRREFSEKTKRAARRRAAGKCEQCKAPLSVLEKKYVHDHIIPDAIRKDNSLSNCQVLCLACNAKKTSKDVQIIAKCKRIQRKWLRRERRKRGFRAWRKFDGTIVRVERRK